MTLQLDNQVEAFLADQIFPDLEQGRPGFDKPHTQAVVYHLKILLPYSPSPIDPIPMLVAAYAHDWGYSGLFQSRAVVQYEEVQQAKKLHMQLGADKLAQLLKNPVFDKVSSKQKQRAVHLVAVHDDIKNLQAVDELLLMEADTLGAIDISFVKPTFDVTSNDQFIAGIYRKRLPKFITAFGKQVAERLIEERQHYYQQSQVE